MAKCVLSAPHFQDESAAFAYVESKLWPDGPVCHFCGERERIGRLKGKTTRPGLHKCYACQKPFTVRMGTIFESSHIPLHLWLQVIHLMCASKKGISTRQIQRMLECSMKTAWFMAHRIREAMAVPSSDPLGGANKVVEADETYVGGKARNRKGKVPPKAAVFSLVERDGRVRSFHVANVNGANLKPILAKHVDPQTYVMTDEAPVYPPIVKSFAGHGAVNHSIEEYVRGAFWHTNNAEGYFSVLKRGVIGIYHHVSQRHLRRYLAEFDFRHNTRAALGVDDTKRADCALVGIRGKRLTYRTTHRQMTA